ncbi:hypothetical protein AYI68_g2222 [Smittium mucronatum]|uniref:Uncharacterized protein n=1 Tax=Smittium mucronatum TaxID=133383 RepID=A0A1R0H3C9_9FUNG|nr:hypothetical protein AYI68_g2222 [Smittium mucronatum]
MDKGYKHIANGKAYSSTIKSLKELKNNKKFKTDSHGSFEIRQKDFIAEQQKQNRKTLYDFYAGPKAHNKFYRNDYISNIEISEPIYNISEYVPKDFETSPLLNNPNNRTRIRDENKPLFIFSPNFQNNEVENERSKRLQDSKINFGLLDMILEILSKLQEMIQSLKRSSVALIFPKFTKENPIEQRESTTFPFGKNNGISHNVDDTSSLWKYDEVSEFTDEWGSLDYRIEHPFKNHKSIDYIREESEFFGRSHLKKGKKFLFENSDQTRSGLNRSSLYIEENVSSGYESEVSEEYSSEEEEEEDSDMEIYRSIVERYRLYKKYEDIFDLENISEVDFIFQNESNSTQYEVGSNEYPGDIDIAINGKPGSCSKFYIIQTNNGPKYFSGDYVPISPYSFPI